MPRVGEPGFEDEYLAFLAAITRPWFGRIVADLHGASGRRRAPRVAVSVEVGLRVGQGGAITTPRPGWLNPLVVQRRVEEFLVPRVPDGLRAKVIVSIEARGVQHLRVVYGGE